MTKPLAQLQLSAHALQLPRPATAAPHSTTAGLTCVLAGQVCEAVPDSPSAIGHLDGDTAVSRGTAEAAFAAAGAVCRAVDEVVCGTVLPCCPLQPGF